VATACGPGHRGLAALSSGQAGLLAEDVRQVDCQSARGRRNEG
jgi:hypothetical protein